MAPPTALARVSHSVTRIPWVFLWSLSLGLSLTSKGPASPVWSTRLGAALPTLSTDRGTRHLTAFVIQQCDWLIPDALPPAVLGGWLDASSPISLCFSPSRVPLLFTMDRHRAGCSQGGPGSASLLGMPDCPFYLAIAEQQSQTLASRPLCLTLAAAQSHVR